MLPKEITSLQHPIVKTFVKLRTSRKLRYEKNQVVIAGIKQTTEANHLEILLVKKGFSFHPLTAKEVYFVTEEILKKATGVETPEPLAAVVQMPQWSSFKGKNWIVCLDGIADPGNLGTLLRTALALGWEGVFLTKTCADPFNDKALSAAKGATFRLPLRMGDAREIITFANEEKLPVWIAEMNGTPLSEIPRSNRALLILGNEAQGVSEELKNLFDSVSIPISKIESLNVAAAGAILMYNIKI